MQAIAYCNKYREREKNMVEWGLNPGPPVRPSIRNIDALTPKTTVPSKSKSNLILFQLFHVNLYNN